MSRLFRRPYTMRRRGEQKIVKGHSVSSKTEFTVKLNIHPLSKNDLLALPEGKRTIARIRSFGANALISADEQSKTPGDLLYYGGKWYECVSCVHWPHTPLTHYEAEFVLLADQAKHKPPKASEFLPGEGADKNTADFVRFAGGDAVDGKPTENSSI